MASLEFLGKVTEGTGMTDIRSAVLEEIVRMVEDEV